MMLLARAAIDRSRVSPLATISCTGLVISRLDRYREGPKPPLQGPPPLGGGFLLRVSLPPPFHGCVPGRQTEGKQKDGVGVAPS